MATKKTKKISPKISVKNLAACRRYVPLVSNWLWQQWDKRHNRTLKEIIYRTEHCLTNKCPQILVAFYGAKPVGTISLWKADHPYRQDLGPWLSCLLVLKKYRNLGIGKILQQELLKTARRAGFRKVYLFTELKNYYEKSGWRFVETATYTERRKVGIYEYKL